MSKKPNKSKKRLSYHATEKLPQLSKIKTEWDLKSHYYKSLTDPQIEKDIAKAERAYLVFAKKWRTKKFTTSAKVLAKALSEYEALLKLPGARKAGRYYSFLLNLNAQDAAAQKKSALLSNRWRDVSNELVFFSLALGSIPKSKQKELLKDPKLEKYKYYLERTWLSAKYDLSEAEEKIINLKSNQSYGAWVDMTEKIISSRSVSFAGKNIPFYEALESLDGYPLTERKKLWKLLMTEMEQIGEVAEHEFNAIITDVSTEETLRGYEKPYSATAISYQDSEESIERLVDAVSTTGFTLSKKFYQLKAKLHNVDTLHYTQKYDPVGKPLHVPFDQAVDICRDVFHGISTKYGDVFDTMLQNGQIDVYPKQFKRGGAFMAETLNLPTYVMLNHTDNLSSLRTIAHEMGHAIHAERGKAQPPFYQGHSITTAETASTLFENLLFDALIDQASPEEKKLLLHDKVAQNIATIQRQIACFNAELEIHETIKQAGAMTNEELRACMYRQLKRYVGPAVDLEPSDGYSYVYWSHLRFGFYVYTYTYGILMSTIMANNYKEDNGYAKEIDAFLTAGESADVKTIFNSIGINTTHPDTFKDALKNHQADINEFKKLLT